MQQTARALLLAAMVVSAGLSPGQASEFTFDPSEFKKSALQISGYVEGKGEYFRYDRASAFYRLNATETNLGSRNGRVIGTAEIRARYEKDWLTASATVHGDGQWDADQPDSGKFKLFESGITARPSAGFSLSAGKKILKWGKGYGWNPVGFVERPKDPTDPDLSREGFWLGSVEYVKSFDGPLQAISITSVILPVTQSINAGFGSREDVNFGGKLYLLYMDTDIDIMFLASGTRTTRIGADFSRNILSNLEIHGELAFISDAERRVLDGSRNIVTLREDAQGKPGRRSACRRPLRPSRGLRL